MRIEAQTTNTHLLQPTNLRADDEPVSAVHPRLIRLEALAVSLAQGGDVTAVLGLGSAGVEHARFDDHSDIDFFVVVVDLAAKARFLSSFAWLASMGTVVYSFVNDSNGRKALYSDGLFVEFAVFTAEELADIPFAGARVVWRRPGVDVDLSGAGVPSAGVLDTVEFHLNEALTNLFVGLHRDLRGETLTAFRFIQVFAVDRVLALARLTRPAHLSLDRFDATRRVEAAHPDLIPPLRRMLAGYDDNRAAARAVLDWLTHNFPADPAITEPVEALIARAAAAAR
ncbi:hypothetical protein [Nakamurella deserti]|uniref:hypothetical protein n=1 Tax=Nakamurella deserti TaxID=2164074 RepID=UPI001300A123|nr:hypothetical protein [Nakamurella deserti]